MFLYVLFVFFVFRFCLTGFFTCLFCHFFCCCFFYVLFWEREATWSWWVGMWGGSGGREIWSKIVYVKHLIKKESPAQDLKVKERVQNGEREVGPVQSILLARSLHLGVQGFFSLDGELLHTTLLPFANSLGLTGLFNTFDILFTSVGIGTTMSQHFQPYTPSRWKTFKLFAH